MNDKRDGSEPAEADTQKSTTQQSTTQQSTTQEQDTQENHNAETDEDTASGGAAADPNPHDL